MGLFSRKRYSIRISKNVRINFNKSGPKLNIRTPSLFSLGKSSGRKRTRTYHSSAYSKKLAILMREQQKLDQLAQNRLTVEKYENYIDIIRHVHKECDETVDWDAIHNEPIPFDPHGPGPREQKAQKKLDDYTPSWWDKLFGLEKSKKLQLTTEVNNAKAEDNNDMAAWQMRHNLAQRILDGDIEAFCEVIESSNPFEDLTEYGSDFEFSTDDPRYLEVEFKVKSKTVIPENSQSLTSTGKLSTKKLSKTAYYDYTQDYVCSCSIRLARELFALLPVSTIIVHAIDDIINSANGQLEEQVILSVAFTRNKFKTINFDYIDASDCVESFQHNMKFKKTAGFMPISRLDASQYSK